MKKKLAVFSIAMALLIGSVNVYAVSEGTNIINLIKNGFVTIQTYYTNMTNKQMDDVSKKYKIQIGQYISEKTNSIIREIEGHSKNEIQRADTELDNYMKSVMQQVDSESKEQVTILKNEITRNVNSQIDLNKNEINKEFENQIKEKLKK